MAVQLLLVDDDAAFRAAARVVLDAGGFEVAGEAASGIAAIEAVESLRPAVVLLDVQLPDMDGFEVARRLRMDPRPPAVVLISTREAVDYGQQVAASGARGFITKAALTGDALRAILLVNGRRP